MSRRLPFARSSLALALLATGYAKGTHPPAARPGDAAAPAVEPQGPVIVRLVGQHQEVTITSGPAGPLYCARTTAGQPVVANATLEQLRAAHPDVYRFVEPGVAADASLDGAGPAPAAATMTGPKSARQLDRMLIMRHAGE